jgi:Ca2+/Na+ antiporter
MTAVVIYLMFCALVGLFASDTTLGFWSGFLLSILLTPIGGFIIYLFYPSKEKARQRVTREQQLLQEQQKQTMLLQNLNRNHVSIADEISKLKKQMDDGTITAEEFTALKAKLI